MGMEYLSVDVLPETEGRVDWVLLALSAMLLIFL